MKQLFLLLILLCCSLSSNAQTDSTEVKKPTYSVRHGFVSEETVKMTKADEFQQRHLFQAGIAMQKGTQYATISLVASFIGGALFGVSAFTDNDRAKTGLYVGGGIMAGAAMGCTFATIHFHGKAARELRLSAGEVIYKF